MSTMAQKTFIPLENNPEVMTKLAYRLGLSPAWSFRDVYSLTDPDLLALLPRPAAALLFVYPETQLSQTHRAQKVEAEPEYHGCGPAEPVIFYHQTIHHACGLIGLLHCTTNGPAAQDIRTGSDLAQLVHDALPLRFAERAQYLHDSDALEQAHAAAAQSGDTTAPPLGEDPGHAFIAFVKGKDGHLYELEGCSRGPRDCGPLADDEDVLSAKALRLGPLPFIQREEASGQGMLRFSCTVLAPTMDE